MPSDASGGSTAADKPAQQTPEGSGFGGGQKRTLSAMFAVVPFRASSSLPPADWKRSRLALGELQKFSPSRAIQRRRRSAPDSLVGAAEMAAVVVVGGVVVEFQLQLGPAGRQRKPSQPTELTGKMGALARLGALIGAKSSPRGQPIERAPPASRFNSSRRPRQTDRPSCASEPSSVWPSGER